MPNASLISPMPSLSQVSGSMVSTISSPNCDQGFVLECTVFGASQFWQCIDKCNAAASRGIDVASRKLCYTNNLR
jgi:hypothetical protein